MNNKNNTLLLILNAVLLCGLIGIYILHFTQKNSATKHNAEAVDPLVKEGGLTIGYIDADSLLVKYQYAIDLNKELEDYRDQQRRHLEQQMTSFQTDYQNYLQTGSTMTLTQQQAKEEELKKRADKLQTLEQELANKVAERQIEETNKLMNAVYAFVREYNAANQQFDIVLNKSTSLYINPAMDITDEIISGLNEEYARVKGK